MIDYEIISTGSKGNAVVINKNILIDCGVPFKALLPCYKDFQLVLLTHCHGDHFNRNTISKLAYERPTLRWAAPAYLLKHLDLCEVNPQNIDVCVLWADIYKYADFSIKAFQLIHDVPNCGYKIHFASGEKLIYATDTNSMDGISAKNYNLYMLEANYSEAEIKDRIQQKQEQGEYCHEWNVLDNHLSKEKADNWLYQNMGANSQYIYMHGHEE